MIVLIDVSKGFCAAMKSQIADAIYLLTFVLQAEILYENHTNRGNCLRKIINKSYKNIFTQKIAGRQKL